ncbi:MAG: hypothetical protein IJR47_05360 [Clostridia bacterium]|nr:hypothetical protein [Clostridia bacterium]
MAEVKLELGAFKGLDTYSHPALMPSGYSPNCYNVSFEAGILNSAKGFGRISEKTGIEKAFDHYKKSDESVRLVLRSGNVEDFETGNALQADFYENAADVSFVNYQLNNTYITVILGGGAPLKYDGETISLLGGNPPNARFVELHNERLFMAGDADNPDRIYYSESFNPESWNVEIESGYIDLPSWDGGRIKEIKSLFGDLVVFKDYGLYRLYGTYPGEFGVEKISSNVGCVDKGTIAVSGEACFFLNEKGLCVYDGMSARPVTEKRLEAVFERVDYNRINEARLYDYYGKLYMFLPSLDGDFVVEYDYGEKVIVKKQGFKVKQFFADKNGLFIADGFGRICKYDAGTSFDNQAMDCFWKSKSFVANGSGEQKCVYAVGFNAKGEGALNICVCADGKRTQKQVELSSEAGFYRVPFKERGRSLSLEISNSTGGSFKLDGLCIYMDIEEE